MAATITVGDYIFGLGNVGAEFEFKFTTATETNSRTVIRIYIPEHEMFIDPSGIPLTLTMTQGNGVLSQYDSATESIQITGYWSTYASDGQAVTLRIRGWRMPNSRGEYGFYLKTFDLNGG